MDKSKVIIIIVGPTASGKSDLAIRLARRFDGEIVSADSRQIYRGMDLGTGKVTRREQKLAKHWLLDIANPKRQFTVADFQRLGRAAITDIHSRGKLPIICGGTGFYIDALIYAMTLPDVPPNKKLRTQLEKRSVTQLFARLQRLDSRRAHSIGPLHKRRLIRALEIVLTTRQPVPYTHQKTSPYDILWLGITRSKGVLTQRIAKRLDARIRQGMIAEVRRLYDRGVGWKRLEAFGLEYRWIARFLQKKITHAEMRAGILRESIAYAKRQMTWFKRNVNIAWVSHETQAMRLTKRFLS